MSAAFSPALPNVIVEEDRTIEEVVTDVLNARLLKLMISMWVIGAGMVASLIFVGVEWGTVKTKLQANERADDAHHGDTSVHMGIESNYKTFISREEYVAAQANTTTAVSELKASMLRVESKLDALKDRSPGG